MTNQEAIEILQSKYHINGAIKIVCEELEARELAIVALEKQVPKRPTKIDSPGIRYTDTYRCPSCGGDFTGTGFADYCYHCGQHLDWEDISHDR